MPCTFLFVDLSVGEDYGEMLDKAFLRALKIADQNGTTAARIYRGGIFIPTMV